MRLLHLTLFCFALSSFYVESAWELPTSTSTDNSKYKAGNPIKSNKTETAAVNIIYQSRDGGQTWEDISHSLPVNQQPENFFAGESELYARLNNAMYRSKSNLNTPTWEKVPGLDPHSNTIAFNRSGVMAYNYEGNVYQQKYSTDTWVPAFTNFKKPLMRTIFETPNGTLFLGTDNGLYKSADKGLNWKRVLDQGWVINMVEGDGVIIGTGTKGIMRSADNGEHWEWVISEGGVGIAVERIQGGFAAITFNTTTQSRRIRTSMDGGKTWQAIDTGLQPSMTISSIKQAGNYLLVAHPDGIFRSADRGKTWQIVHDGVERGKIKINTVWNAKPEPDNRKVFSLFVSGNVVYAVAHDGGC